MHSGAAVSRRRGEAVKRTQEEGTLPALSVTPCWPVALLACCHPTHRTHSQHCQDVSSRIPLPCIPCTYYNCPPPPPTSLVLLLHSQNRTAPQQGGLGNRAHPKTPHHVFGGALHGAGTLVAWWHAATTPQRPPCTLASSSSPKRLSPPVFFGSKPSTAPL